MKRRTYLVLIWITVILGGFLRFLNLGEIPQGLQQDEVSIGYNAYAILTTGKDEHGVVWPAHFIAFGEYKLPITVYLTVPSIQAFGLNAFAVRFPASLLGTLTVLVVILLTKECFYKESYKNTAAIIAGFLLATNPWHIFFSRAGFEVTIGLFFLSVTCVSFLIGLRKQQTGFIYLTILTGVAAFYTYNTLRLTIPILFLVMAIIYLIKSKAKTFSFHIVLWGLLLLVLLIPFMTTMSTASQATSGTLITSSAVIRSQLLEIRSYMAETPAIIQKIFYSLPLQTGITFIKNILNNLNATFFFLSGPTHGNHGIGTHGLFFLYQLPLLIIGFLLFKKFTPTNVILLTVFSMTIITTAMTRESPYATRSFFLILPVIIMMSYAAVTIIAYLKNQSIFFKRTVISLLLITLCWEGATYFLSYTQRFPNYYAKQWRAADKQLADYLIEKKNTTQKIIIDPRAGVLYASLLFHMGTPVQEFFNTVQRSEPDSEGFISVKKFSNIEYRTINWFEDMRTPNLLLITQPELKPDTVPATKTLYYPQRPVVINQGQEILQFPTQDVAYVIVETK